MDVPTRQRILTATGELFRARGYNATSLKQVAEASEAPIGSVYHFFPGGKEELAEAVVRTSGPVFQELFEAIFEAATDPPSAISDFFEGGALLLGATDYIDPCPIGSVALEVASTNDRLRRATADVFADWQAAAVARLTGAGVAAGEAHDLAATLVAAIQGAFMLSRAARDPAPMQATGRMMRRLVADAVGGGRRRHAGRVGRGSGG
jgi:AcrR family transcriptional regulator